MPGFTMGLAGRKLGMPLMPGAAGMPGNPPGKAPGWPGIWLGFRGALGSTGALGSAVGAPPVPWPEAMAGRSLARRWRAGF
ncbi:MAG: hypothetical protein IPJ98_17385 [Bryobacterales bacterium]|nr:hypothetical protein [Bryobacterales bacterium]